MDTFTKYRFTGLIRTTHKKGIVQALNMIFTRFGQPFSLVADNERELHNKEAVTFPLPWGVQWKFPVSYNSQANGQARGGVKIASAKLRASLMEMETKCQLLHHDEKRRDSPNKN